MATGRRMGKGIEKESESMRIERYIHSFSHISVTYLAIHKSIQAIFKTSRSLRNSDIHNRRILHPSEQFLFLSFSFVHSFSSENTSE